MQSIHHTSLTHALLGASMAPLLIAIGTLILRKPISLGKLHHSQCGHVVYEAAF